IEPTRSALPSPNIRYFHKLREKGIPFVMIDSYFDELNPSYVCVENFLVYNEVGTTVCAKREKYRLLKIRGKTPFRIL
ncbi:hypothetical protein KAT45_00810, partial [Candidatus Aerophobetes bacterium]|nr:hypothetical protein [Candidatus Aerophobetes bacterium]